MVDIYTGKYHVLSFIKSRMLRCKMRQVYLPIREKLLSVKLQCH